MKKILLIEDNEDIRSNTAEILELSNYIVIEAENGKVGVAKAIQNKPIESPWKRYESEAIDCDESRTSTDFLRRFFHT